MKSVLPVVVLLLIAGCATVPSGPDCPPGSQSLPGCPPEEAIADPAIDKLYNARTWRPAHELNADPVEFGNEVDLPTNDALVKVVGSDRDSALRSLATKIWLIRNAQHTVDVIYYIFSRDLVGYAILGTLCEAVGRGVDVRIMVDSLGSFSFTHSELKALQSCAADAGFMRNSAGEVTTRKARVQALVFNALSKLHINRRAHDKLLVVDGRFPEDAVIMTGGRNIALDYYGLTKDGREDPTAYRDLEILLRPGPTEPAAPTVGDVSEVYYTLLFLFDGNNRLGSGEGYDPDRYRALRDRFRRSLSFLESVPDVEEKLAEMDEFTTSGFHAAAVRLAHQMNNLTSEDVTARRKANALENPNSISYLLTRVFAEEEARGQVHGTLRIVSPYLFSSRQKSADGDVVFEGPVALLGILDKFPDVSIEIVTNSVLTTDNIFAQAVVDMDMAPRMLLTPDLRKRWQSGLAKGELDPAVVESEEWRRLVGNPRLKIYQTGRLDSVILGGGTHYGKQHAKFIVSESTAFVGTSNFDYRSILYNNEMGFFLAGEGVRSDLIDAFDELKETSYLWGSPEWLELRRRAMAQGGRKACSTRMQRIIFKVIRALGLEYLL